MTLREWIVSAMLLAIVSLGASTALTGCKEETPATPSTDQLKEAAEDAAQEAEEAAEETKEAAEEATE